MGTAPGPHYFVLSFVLWNEDICTTRWGLYTISLLISYQNLIEKYHHMYRGRGKVGDNIGLPTQACWTRGVFRQCIVNPWHAWRALLVSKPRLLAPNPKFHVWNPKLRVWNPKFWTSNGKIQPWNPNSTRCKPQSNETQLLRVVHMTMIGDCVYNTSFKHMKCIMNYWSFTHLSQWP